MEAGQSQVAGKLYLEPRPPFGPSLIYHTPGSPTQNDTSETGGAVGPILWQIRDK